jgi:transcriptional regulator with XRE-family HTH domain
MPTGTNMMMTEIIADNVNRLMKHYSKTNGVKLTQRTLAIKSGLSQRTVSNALRPGSVDSITSDTIEKLAKFFKIEPFHLIIPGLTTDELLSDRIEKVIDCYAKASSDGRENIRRIAENEVRYSSVSNMGHDS